MEYGLIGEHLGHSFSKEIHNRIADYDYSLKEVARDDIDAFMKEADFKGVNVTIPYKQTVIPYLSYLDENAKKIGAVNTIVNRDGKLYGYNTDYYGLKALIEHLDLNLEDKKVLILGTGGTSKTANAVASSLKAKEIFKVSRKKSENTITYQEAKQTHNDAQIIINTTPVGMYPNNDNKPIDLASFPKLEGVIDVIYNPLRTNLVSQALSLGLKASGGLYMLVFQAIYAYQLFFDTSLDLQKGLDIYQYLLAQKQNIVLTGMPTSGKTTLGRLLSEKTNKKLIDSDIYLVEKYGKSVTDIFACEGEEAFRNYESEVIKEISKENGIIIACGGGTILRKENVESLKANGKIYFLDRPLDKLIPASDRPLSRDEASLKKRYYERFDIYRSTADYKVENDDTISKALNEIMEVHSQWKY